MSALRRILDSLWTEAFFTLLIVGWAAVLIRPDLGPDLGSGLGSRVGPYLAVLNFVSVLFWAMWSVASLHRHVMEWAESRKARKEAA